MIFFDHEIMKESNKLIKFIAVEDNKHLGECILDLRLKYAEVTFVTFDSKTSFITEGLIRSAFNYAANKGFYIGKCKCMNASSVLDRMNFENRDGVYVNDIPSILMGKCCCGEH